MEELYITAIHFQYGEIKIKEVDMMVLALFWEYRRLCFRVEKAIRVLQSFYRLYFSIKIGQIRLNMYLVEISLI